MNLPLYQMLCVNFFTARAARTSPDRRPFFAFFCNRLARVRYRRRTEGWSPPACHEARKKFQPDWDRDAHAN